MALHKQTQRLLYNFVTLTKKHPILTKLSANNAPLIGNQSAKFQLNLLRQTIVTVVYVR